MTFSCASLARKALCLQSQFSQSFKMTLFLARVKMETVQLVGIQWHQQSGRYPSSDLRLSLLSNTTNHSSAHLGRPLPTLARRWSVPPPFPWGPWLSAGLWTWLQDAAEVNAMKEGEGSERSYSSFTFCSSREGTGESGRLYRPLLLILVPSLSPLHSYNYIYLRPTHPSVEDTDSVKSSF